MPEFPAVPAVPDPAAVREALAWFRQVADVRAEMRFYESWDHAATVVRAALARDDVGSAPDLLRECAEMLRGNLYGVEVHRDRRAVLLRRIDAALARDIPADESPEAGYGPTINLAQAEREGTWPYGPVTPTLCDVPAGRDLTAQDLLYASRLAVGDISNEAEAVRHLNSIARPARDVSESTDEPSGVPALREIAGLGCDHTTSCLSAPDATDGDLCRSCLADAWLWRLTGGRVATDEPPPVGVSGRAGTTSSEPLPGLPASLASVDDVRRVCEAAGLVQSAPDRWSPWADDVVRVEPSYGVTGVATVHVGDRWVASVMHNADSRQLWSAIQAARSAL